jgi:hypothetical protein
MLTNHWGKVQAKKNDKSEFWAVGKAVVHILNPTSDIPLVKWKKF